MRAWTSRVTNGIVYLHVEDCGEKAELMFWVGATDLCTVVGKETRFFHHSLRKAEQLPDETFQT